MHWVAIGAKSARCSNPLWALPDALAGCAAGPHPDLSARRAQLLVQALPAALPKLPELEQALFQPPAAKLPVTLAVKGGLADHDDLAALCEVDDGSNATLCVGLTQAMHTPFPVGEEALTLSGINRFLLDLLVYNLDRLVPESLGLSVRRDKGDSDTTMTKLSASRKSLRPDGQLRSRDGKRLLFKWEEKGAGASLDDAVEDLKRESCTLSVYFCGRLRTCIARQDQKPS